VSAGKYKHIGERGGDWDGVAVGLPDDAEPGHYVLWWHWSGYYDCVDFDRFPEKVDDANKYGVDKPNYVYNRIDHCQYQEPRMIKSSCLVTKSAAECRKLIEKFSPDDGKSSVRIGINVIPAHNPVSKVAFDFVNIPWNNHTCANSEATMVTGTVTKSALPINWANWKQTKTEGASCKKFMNTDGGGSNDKVYNTMSLQSAVLTCSMAKCTGIVWKVSPTPMQSGVHEFQFCLDVVTTTPKEGHTIFLKSQTAVPYVPPPASPSDWVAKVSFQSANVAAPPAGWVADTGAVKGSNKYGWSCETKMTGQKADLNYQTTWIGRQKRCPDGSNRVWEHDLPNGVYNISTFHSTTYPATPYPNGPGTHACAVEGVQMTASGTKDSNDPFVTTVEVRDGKLTFSTQYHEQGPRCDVTNYIMIQRVASATLPDLWLPVNPARGAAWWQLRLDDVEPVGLVHIKPPSMKDYNPKSRSYPRHCAAHLLTRGTDKCQPKDQAGYTEPLHRGAVVSVGDAPCSGDDCPGGTVCTVIDGPVRCTGDIPGGIRDASQYLCSYYVDCKGAVGRYVRVHLPGTKRIFEAEVVVNKAQPTLPKDSFVCYAVEARTQTETAPEITITDDPMDPAFYSTCYVREQDIAWRPPAIKSTPAKPKWEYNGQCLDCDTYERNRQPHNVTDMPAIPWALSDTCEACDGESLTALAARLQPTPQSDGDGVGAGTVIGWMIFVALVIAVAGLAVRYRAQIADKARALVPSSSAGPASSSAARANKAGDFANPLAQETSASASEPAHPSRPAPPATSAQAPPLRPAPPATTSSA